MLPGMPDFKSLGAGFDKLLTLLTEIERSLRRIADALEARNRDQSQG